MDEQFLAPQPTIFSLLARAGYKSGLLEHIITRLDPLDDFSGIELVFSNVFRALVALDRQLPDDLPAPLKLVIPEIREVNEYVRQVGISTLATRSDSGRANTDNTTFGRYKNHPIYACFAEKSAEWAGERAELSLGLLLLARLRLNAPSITPKESEVADGLRKAVSNKDWLPVIEFLPQSPDDLQRLHEFDRQAPQLASLKNSQRDFLAALASLVGKHSSQSSTFARGFSRTAKSVDADDSEDDLQAFAVQFVCYRPGTSEGDIDDDSEAIEYVESLPTPASKAEELPEHRLQSDVFNAAYRSVRDNQFLPYRWRTLTDWEAKDFVREARECLATEKDQNLRRKAIVAGLVFVTSHSPSSLARFVVVKEIDESMLGACMSENVIDLGRRVWWHLWPIISGRFTPNLKQQALLQPNSDWIQLPLPIELCSALCGVGDAATTLSDLLWASAGQMESWLREFCTQLRAGSNRTSPARVRAHGFDYFVRQTGDDSFASAIQGTLEYAPPGPLYYYAFRSEEGIQAHKGRLASMGWSMPSEAAIAPEDVLFGSRLQPTREAVERLVIRLESNLSSAREAFAEHSSPKTIAAVQNAMAIYTLVMAISASGHRIAREYSYARLTMDVPNFLMLLADKILGSASSIRQMAMPVLLAAQLEEYFQHLELLAAKVARYAPASSAQIRSLTEANPAHAAAPLFFWIDEQLSDIEVLSHSRLLKALGDDWLLPWNYMRHLLETTTRAKGLSAEFNHYRAGHLSFGQQPSSPSSPLVPKEVGTKSAEVVNQLLQEQGWSQQSGLSGRRRSPQYFERAAATRLRESYVPSGFVRARSVVEASNSKVVMAAIASVKQKLGKTQGLDDAAVNQIREEILRASSSHPFLAMERLNLFRKILIGTRKTGEFRIRRVPGLVAQFDEKPAFESEAALHIREAEVLRLGFLDLLASRESYSPEDAVADIAFALVAFSSFTMSGAVPLALRACIANAFTLDEVLWVEFQHGSCAGDKERRNWIRRPLDPVTTCLVLSAREKFGAALQSCCQMSDQAVEGAVLRTAKLASRNAEFSVEVPGTLRGLCKLFVPFFRYVLPGIHAAWCEGRSQSVSMARPDFLRVMTGQVPADTGFLPISRAPDIAGTQIPLHKKSDFVSARKLMRRIGQILISARPDSVSGGKAATHYAQKMAKARDELAGLEHRLISAPNILQILAAWIVQLMEEGGAVKSSLQISTIATYFWAISYPLIAFLFDEDLASLDSTAMEDLYSQALDTRSDKTRAGRARVLRQFHNFGVARYGLPDVDWYEIEPLIDAVNDYVDANLVTPAEFERAKVRLSSDVDSGNLVALKVSVLMILMFRAGLRLGEAFRLTLDDIVFDEGELVLLIRGNRYGKPKTPNGRRMIRIGWRLPQDELSLIKRLMSLRSSMCGKHPEVCLFGSSAHPHQLDVRRVLEKELSALLRWATNRCFARPHHLRHSMASFCTASQFGLCEGTFFTKSVSEYFGNASNPGEALRLALLGSRDSSRRISHAICSETGHGSPSLLFSVYANCLEIPLACHLWRSVKETLGDRSDSSITGKTQARGKAINKYLRASALSGLSDARLRRLMHDGTDVTDPAVLARYLIRRHPLQHGVEMLDPGTLPDYQPGWRGDVKPTLEQLHGILTAAVAKQETDRIAETWAVPKEHVEKVIAAAKALSKSCDYRRYGATTLADTWEKNDENSWDDFPKMPSPRIGDAYSKFSAALTRLEEHVIVVGIRAWVEAYSPAFRGIVCRSPGALQAIWEFLIALGYKKDRIVVAIPLLDAKRRQTYFEGFRTIGIPGNSIEFKDAAYLRLDSCCCAGRFY